MGASLPLLLKVWARDGFVAPRHAGLALGMLGSALLRAPVGLVEQWMWRRGEGPALEPPVFIIGHWRSGTTHLHNLMGKAPCFGHISPLATGLPNELLTLATWLRPWLEKALPEDRHVDQVQVTPDSPQEDEIPLANLQPHSVFHGLYFPRHFEDRMRQGIFFEGLPNAAVEEWKLRMQHFLQKVARHQGKGLLLVKNPVYTARIGLLRELWPQARFVHIHRDPTTVFVSTVHYYRKLLAMYALQDPSSVDVESFVLQTYSRLMEAYDAQIEAVPAHLRAEVGFEALEAAPLQEVARIWSELELPDWAEAEPPIRDYLDSIRGYAKNRFEVSDEVARTVEGHWGKWVQRYAT
ncbi:MAG: sulfotransferase [Myxococcota bacterium]